MEGIFAIEREDDVNNSELIHEIQFSQLCSVTLSFLPQLKSFCHRVKKTSQLQLTSSTNDGEIISEDMIDIPKSLFNEKIGFPSLKEMKIKRCSKFKEFIFNDKVVFPNLETLRISSTSAEKIWHNQLPTMSSSFQNLNRLDVYNCDNLKELFPSSMVNSFVQLQYLKISNCSLLEEVVFMEELKEEERKDTQFPSLKEMTIINCPNFKGFISNDKIGFPSLKKMEIKGCPKLKEFIFNDKVAVPNLEKLAIWRIDNSEKICHNQLVKDSFCKLKSLEVGLCKKLLNVFPSNICERLLSSLESLEVRWCYSLEEIFDLRELSIYDSQIILSFASLQRLNVSECDSLKNLFSASILAKEGAVMEEAPTRFLFPKLTSLELIDLRELRSFYPGRHKVEGPVLETKGIHDIDEEGQMQQPFVCSSVEEIEFPSLKKMEIKRCPKLKEFIFNDKVAVPNLEKLTIWDTDNLEKIWHNQLVKDSFCKLKSLVVYSCKKLLNVFPSNICGRLLSLESLDVRWCHSLEEIFDLRELSVHDSQIMLSFESLQRLKVLKVERCDSLINLMPPPTSFQNLTSLEVYGCNSLINIGTSSVAKSLVQLTKMSISSCKKITEVIGNHGDVIEDEINFRKLKSLKLQSLPSLISFCSWNFTLKFPSLETLSMGQCPNMKIFSQGDLTTEKLQEVKIDWVSVELHPDFNLNTTIQQSHEKAISAKDNGASSSRHLK